MREVVQYEEQGAHSVPPLRSVAVHFSADTLQPSLTTYVPETANKLQAIPAHEFRKITNNDRILVSGSNQLLGSAPSAEMANLEILQNMKGKIEKMVTEVQDIRKEMGVAVQGLQGLQSQLTENKLVKEELDQLEEGAKVYKLVGPVLIPQEPDEAKNTVQTRIDFISKELHTATSKVEKAEKEQQKKRMALIAEQQKFQTLVQQSAAGRQ